MNKLESAKIIVEREGNCTSSCCNSCFAGIKQENDGISCLYEESSDDVLAIKAKQYIAEHEQEEPHRTTSKGRTVKTLEQTKAMDFPYPPEAKPEHKPCPRCGSEDIKLQDLGEAYMYCVYCNNCKIVNEGKDLIEEAWADWDKEWKEGCCQNGNNHTEEDKPEHCLNCSQPIEECICKAKPEHKPCPRISLEINDEYFVNVDDNGKWKPILEAIENHLEDTYCNECLTTIDGMSMSFKIRSRINEI